MAFLVRLDGTGLACVFPVDETEGQPLMVALSWRIRHRLRAREGVVLHGHCILGTYACALCDR